ncbi:MAG TPA: G5 domain-containing protein, partial [Acidimicrobiia bacterium]|nr:G5 domain-containing protein [Acidimicrobiia bacterium]
MPLTSTDTPRAARRRRRRRVRGALLALAVAVPAAGFAATRGGPAAAPPAALASSVAADRDQPERASRSGLRVEEPVPPPAVTVTADGATRDVYVRAATVGELLAGLGLAVDGDDEVTPPLGAPPGRAVTVVRVEVTRVSEERVIPTPKELRDDPALARGSTRVEADGSPGRERLVWEIVRRDGKVTAKRQVSVETLVAASPRVVIVGRGDGRGAPTGDGPPPLRIAASGAPGGTQEGGASWYRYKPGTCAHRTLPKGTRVTVTNVKS